MRRSSMLHSSVTYKRGNIAGYGTMNQIKGNPYYLYNISHHHTVSVILIIINKHNTPLFIRKKLQYM